MHISAEHPPEGRQRRRTAADPRITGTLRQNHGAFDRVPTRDHTDRMLIAGDDRVSHLVLAGGGSP